MINLRLSAAKKSIIRVQLLKLAANRGFHLLQLGQIMFAQLRLIGRAQRGKSRFCSTPAKSRMRRLLFSMLRKNLLTAWGAKTASIAAFNSPKTCWFSTAMPACVYVIARYLTSNPDFG